MGQQNFQKNWPILLHKWRLSCKFPWKFATEPLLALVFSTFFATFAQEDGNARFWSKNNKLFSVGYSTGTFDLGEYNGGELNSRWGLGLRAGGNIMLHRKPIAQMLKFGIFIGVDVNYLNFEKGHGSISDLIDDSYDEDALYPDEEGASIGSHYIAAGLAVGPTLTVMPFIHSSNENLARLKFRPFFHLVPSFSALITSDSAEDTHLNGAFALMYSGGLEVMWRKLSVAVSWKGGRARYNDLVKDIVNDYEGIDDVWVGAGDNAKTPRMGTRLFTVSLGLSF